MARKKKIKKIKSGKQPKIKYRDILDVIKEAERAKPKKTAKKTKTKSRPKKTKTKKAKSKGRKRWEPSEEYKASISEIPVNPGYHKARFQYKGRYGLSKVEGQIINIKRNKNNDISGVEIYMEYRNPSGNIVRKSKYVPRWYKNDRNQWETNFNEGTAFLLERWENTGKPFRDLVVKNTALDLPRGPDGKLKKNINWDKYIYPGEARRARVRAEEERKSAEKALKRHKRQMKRRIELNREFSKKNMRVVFADSPKIELHIKPGQKIKQYEKELIVNFFASRNEDHDVVVEPGTIQFKKYSKNADKYLERAFGDDDGPKAGVIFRVRDETW